MRKSMIYVISTMLVINILLFSVGLYLNKSGNNINNDNANSNNTNNENTNSNNTNNENTNVDGKCI